MEQRIKNKNRIETRGESAKQTTEFKVVSRKFYVCLNSYQQSPDRKQLTVTLMHISHQHQIFSFMIKVQHRNDFFN